MSHFLLSMWDGGGNVPPALGVAKRLMARGHVVTVLGDPTLADEARAIGARHIPWTTAPHRKSRRPEDDLVKDYEFGNPLKMIREYIKLFLGDPAPRWAADTKAALSSSGADVLVCDLFIPASMIAAEQLEVPTAAYCPNIWIMPTPGIPAMGPGLAPARGPLGRVRDAIMRALVRRAMSPATPYLNAVRSSYGLAPVNNVYDQMLRADEIYILTSPHFDFTSPAMPSQVRYAGPILDDPVWCQPWRSPWPAGDLRPLVLVGLSSTYQNQAAALRRVVEALSTLPVRGLVTLGLTIAPGEVPSTPNVVVVPTAPHAAVLRETSVLVTHCGHGTTMRGLAAGVPLVCMPMGRDQNDTAARVVYHGAGMRLSPKASAAKIRNAVETVLKDPAYRQNAKRLQSAILSHDGCVDIVASLERLAKNRPIASNSAACEATAAPGFAATRAEGRN